ncbi:MAG: HAMP domain-containing histidine kinase [Myxococcota bacterium]|nr:HAMP domain-containing histidine kinase [Myxococcota bacterium]
MNLAPKLLGPQLVVLAALVALTTWQVFVSSQQGHRLEESVRKLSDAGIQLQQLELRTAELHRDLLILRADPTPRLRRRIDETATETRALLGLLEAHEFGPRERGLVRDLSRLYAAMVEVQGRVVRAAQAGSSAPDAGAYVSWWFVSQKADAILADLSVGNLSRLDRALADFAEAQRRIDAAMVALTAACALLVIAFALYVLRGVLRPLRAITEASRRVGVDGPSSTIPRMQGRRDEIGVLARALAGATERISESNAELSRAVSAREQFLSIAAHELKTPLTSLTLTTNQLTRALAAGHPLERLQPIGTRIDRQLRRTTRLVEDLLDVSRMKAQRLELRTEPVALTSLVNEVLERFADQLAEASIVVTGDRDPGLRVDADPSRLDQVLVNLLSNAVKYAPAAPLEVRVFSEGADAVVSVRDQGAGIPGDLRGRLFEPFARAQAARASGLGLGLFISRSIMEAHQGRLDFAQGDRGAHFLLRLPRMAESPLS